MISPGPVRIRIRVPVFTAAQIREAHKVASRSTLKLALFCATNMRLAPRHHRSNGIEKSMGGIMKKLAHSQPNRSAHSIPTQTKEAASPTSSAGQYRYGTSSNTLKRSPAKGAQWEKDSWRTRPYATAYAMATTRWRDHVLPNPFGMFPSPAVLRGPDPGRYPVSNQAQRLPLAIACGMLTQGSITVANVRVANGSGWC